MVLGMGAWARWGSRKKAGHAFGLDLGHCGMERGCDPGGLKQSGLRLKEPLSESRAPHICQASIQAARGEETGSRSQGPLVGELAEAAKVVQRAWCLVPSSPRVCTSQSPLPNLDPLPSPPIALGLPGCVATTSWSGNEADSLSLLARFRSGSLGQALRRSQAPALRRALIFSCSRGGGNSSRDSSCGVTGAAWLDSSPRSPGVGEVGRGTVRDKHGPLLPPVQLPVAHPRGVRVKSA